MLHKKIESSRRMALFMLLAFFFVCPSISIAQFRAELINSQHVKVFDGSRYIGEIIAELPESGKYVDSDGNAFAIWEVKDNRLYVYKTNGEYEMITNAHLPAFEIMYNKYCRVNVDQNNQNYQREGQHGPISIRPRDPYSNAYKDWKIWVDGEFLSFVPFNGYLEFGNHIIEIGYGPYENRYVHKKVEINVSYENEVIYVP